MSCATFACSDDTDGPCRDGLATGDQYVVTLGAPQPSSTACPADFDLSEGTELRLSVTATETDGSQCAAGRVAVEDFDGWSWAPDPASIKSGGAADFVGDFLATSADCSGSVTLRILVGGTEIERRWTPASPVSSCPAGCYDKFASEVAKSP